MDERALAVASKLRELTGENKEYLKELKLTIFGNRESKIQIFDYKNIHGSDFYTLKDVGNFKRDKDLDRTRPHEHFMETINILSALRRGENMDRVNMLSPLGPYSRQHRDNPDMNIAESKLAVDSVMLWNAMGANRAMFTDHHAYGDMLKAQAKGEIGNIGLENIMPTYSILTELVKKEDAENITPDKYVVVAPDNGATERARMYAKALGLEYVVLPKQRDTNVLNADGSNPIIEEAYDIKDNRPLHDALAGKTALVIDDMIATGKTNVLTAEKLRNLGAERVICMATFGIFNNGGVWNFAKAHKSGLIDSVYATDLAYLPEELDHMSWFNGISGAEVLAAGIYHSNRGEDLTAYYTQKQHELNEMLRT